MSSLFMFGVRGRWHGHRGTFYFDVNARPPRFPCDKCLKHITGYDDASFREIGQSIQFHRSNRPRIRAQILAQIEIISGEIFDTGSSRRYYFRNKRPHFFVVTVEQVSHVPVNVGFRRPLSIGGEIAGIIETR